MSISIQLRQASRQTLVLKSSLPRSSSSNSFCWTMACNFHVQGFSPRVVYSSRPDSLRITCSSRSRGFGVWLPPSIEYMLMLPSVQSAQAYKSCPAEWCMQDKTQMSGNPKRLVAHHLCASDWPRKRLLHRALRGSIRRELSLTHSLRHALELPQTWA